MGSRDFLCDGRWFWMGWCVTLFDRRGDFVRFRSGRRRKLRGNIREGVRFFAGTGGGLDRQLECVNIVGFVRCGGNRLFRDGKFLDVHRLRCNYGRRRRSGRGWRWSLNGRLGGMRIFEHRSPFIRKIDFLMNYWGIRRGLGLDLIVDSWFSLDR